MTLNFREGLKVVPTYQEEQRIREIDAYKFFISETLPGYIMFMEAINNTITELEKKGVIGKVKLRTRVKAVNSAIVNTNKKELDDVFGFEIIAENERDKEILMLLIHNLFVTKGVRDKNHNKSNGYFAHHCTGGAKIRLDGTEVLELEKHILEAETNELKPEYRDLTREEQKKFNRSEIYYKKPRYPVLRQEIIENGAIDEKLQQDFSNALKIIDEYLNRNQDLRKNIPVVEFQFKTREVEQEIRCGRAQHVKYKRVNEEEIRTKYFQKRLVRGVDFPFVFIRNMNGDLKIEHTSDTLVSMWPFIEEDVKKYHELHSAPVANYDMFFGRAFPDLELYVQRNLDNEPSLSVNGYNEEIAWSILRNKIINNDFVLPDSDRIVNVVGRN